MKEEVTIENIDIDSRVEDRVPFSEGQAVTLTDKPACGAWIRANGESLVGKLHSDGVTFAFTEGIRDGRITFSK